jgi:hypothetical protein
MVTDCEAIRLAGSAHGDHYQIYGTIITAAVIAATGVRLATLALVVSVLVTLLRVDGKRLFVITSVAAALGLMMIVLKDVVLIHLH